MKQSAVSNQQSAFQFSGFRFCHLGFTLVELLVVIAIIALLAGILLPVITTAITKGEITKARGEVHALARAVEAYQMEYSRYPGQTSAGGGGDHEYRSDYKELIGVLRGSNVTSGAFSNPRSMIFLDVSDKSIVTNNVGGDSYAAGNGELADPWGNRYNVVADWDFDNKIDNLADGQDVSGRGVAVWSWGHKNSTSPNANESSHIRSWK
jgi:general secretion pathway protein G